MIASFRVVLPKTAADTKNSHELKWKEKTKLRTLSLWLWSVRTRLHRGDVSIAATLPVCFLNIRKLNIYFFEDGLGGPTIMVSMQKSR